MSGEPSDTPAPPRVPRALRSGSFLAGGLIVAVLLVAALAAPWLAPYGPTTIFPGAEIRPPDLRFWLGGLLLRPAFAHLKKRLDYQEFGGAPLLGVNGVVCIAHGRSSVRAIENAVLGAHALVRDQLIARIGDELREIGGDLLEKHEQRTDLGNG